MMPDDLGSFGGGMVAGALLAFLLSAVVGVIMLRRAPLMPPMPVIDGRDQLVTDDDHDDAGRHRRGRWAEPNNRHVRRAHRPGRPPTSGWHP